MRCCSLNGGMRQRNGQLLASCWAGQTYHIERPLAKITCLPKTHFSNLLAWTILSDLPPSIRAQTNHHYPVCCCAKSSPQSPSMSQIHAMSDDQVQTELRKMTEFIRQEAREKAREIHLKADEEFSIEKSKLVRSETARIDSEYQKKFTQAGMSQQITKSTLANKTRLRILSARQELLDSLFEEANKKLVSTTGKDKKKYEAVLKDLILEGLYALVGEKKVQIRCRKKDDELVKKAAEAAKKEYKEKTKAQDVEIVIDEKERVPEES